MDYIELTDLAYKCKQFRKSIGKLQIDVADETGYSAENVSSFETGRNNNAMILYWYFYHGMKAEL